MDAISLLVSIFLVGLCQPTPHVHHASGQVYRVTTWTCHNRPEIAVWERRCPKDGTDPDGGWWTRPFLLLREDGKGFYLNKFGEAIAGEHVDANDVYIPSCDV